MSTNTSSTSSLRASFGLALVTLVMFGLTYSLFAAGLGRVLFPHTATGSLIERDGKVVGSALVAQPFSADRYFQPRPSASNYDVMALSGSNQARTNPDLRKRVEEARAAIAARESVAPDAVPSDLVTQSGSGINPHISLQAARIQMARVAKARAVTPAQVEELIARHTGSAQFGLFGQPRVNVLELNLALDTFIAPSDAK
jgi:potassium-transporting ATPase KdpC subunit